MYGVWTKFAATELLFCLVAVEVAVYRRDCFDVFTLTMDLLS